MMPTSGADGCPASMFACLHADKHCTFFSMYTITRPQSLLHVNNSEENNNLVKVRLAGTVKYCNAQVTIIPSS